MKQIPFIELTLNHEYYADGSCTDFVIEPSPATEKLLRNHRCVLKTSAVGLRIFIGALESGAPLIPPSTDAVFSFHMRLNNKDFTSPI